MRHGSIQINQTLHGYKNGHELIAGSVNLPLPVKRTMLVLSDMSGTGIQPGFEEYYTGYPLKESNSYALAKTWYAPEMERPGCVWTHTLIIAFADLALINDPQRLTSKFMRPGIDENNFGKYEDAFDIIVEEPQRTLSLELPEYLAKEVIISLYGQKNKAVLIVDKNGFRWNHIFFAIWLQQWPRLRRSFTFCTGAISVRYFEKSLFDLQVISNLAKHDSLLTPISAKIIEAYNREKEELYLPWVESIYSDLMYPSRLRVFLRKYGIDLPGGRATVSSLVKTFLFFEDHRNAGIKESIGLLAINFKKKNEGNSLKQSVLFNDKKGFDFNFPHYSIVEVLEELSLSEFYLSFDLEKMDIITRFTMVYEVDKASFFKLVKSLINKNINEYGEALLIHAAQLIDYGDVESLLNDSIPVFFTLESIHPKHCYSENVWLSLEKNQKEYLSLLFKSHTIHRIDWQKIVYIILKIRANITPDDFSEKNITIIPHILGYLEETHDELEYKWVVYVKYHFSEVLGWLTYNEVNTYRVLHFVLSILNPNLSEVYNSETDIWIRLLGKFPTDHVLCSFALTISFNKSSKQAIELLSLTFDNVYDALKFEKLDYESWQFLEAHTQPLNFFKNWDKCKKLINAVAGVFIEKKIPMTFIESITNNQEVSGKVNAKIQKLKK